MNKWKQSVWVVTLILTLAAVGCSAIITSADKPKGIESSIDSLQTGSFVSLPFETLGSSQTFTKTPLPSLLTFQTATLVPTEAFLRTPSPVASFGSSATQNFPLTLDTDWVYQYTRYEGFNPDEVVTTTRVVTETVVEVTQNNSFTEVKIRRDEGPEIPLYIPVSMKSVVLRPRTLGYYWFVVIGDRIFHKDEDPATHPLSNEDTLELVLPLRVGNKWDMFGSNSIERRVAKTETIIVPAGRFDNCFSLIDEWIGTKNERWFCPNVGIVDEKNDHLGTPNGYHQVLIKYEP